MTLSGRDLTDVVRCRTCGCHDNAPCLHNGTEACYWVDDPILTDEGPRALCSACSELFDDRVFQVQVCPDCEGEGIAQLLDDDVSDVIEIHCVRCRGTGGLSK